MSGRWVIAVLSKVSRADVVPRLDCPGSPPLRSGTLDLWNWADRVVVERLSCASSPTAMFPGNLGDPAGYFVPLRSELDFTVGNSSIDRLRDGDSAAVAYRSAPFGAGPVVVAVNCPTATLREAVDAVFESTRMEGATVDVLLTIEHGPAGLTVSTRDGTPSMARNTAGVVREVVRRANRLALDGEPNRLHLHAAAVTAADRLIVMSAASRAGKSTLAAACLLEGADYLTDESIALDASASQVSGLCKPITLRSGGAELLPALAPAAVTIDGVRPDAWIVPVSRLPVRRVETAAPFAVVLIERTSATPSIEPLSPADTCVALVEQSMDFERFGSAALGTIASFVAMSHCLRVQVAEPVATARMLLEHVEALGPVPPRRLELIADGDDRWPWADDAVRGASIDDELVLHQGRTGAVVSLRSGGTDRWQELAEGARLDSSSDFDMQMEQAEFLDAGGQRQ